jgi:hypothetical protein
MENNNKPQRNYRMSDATLLRFGNDILMVLERDKDEFLKRGVDQARREALKNLVNLFCMTFPDELHKANSGILTESKKLAKAALITSLRTLFNAASNVYGARSDTLKQFGQANISRLKEEQLIRNAKGAVDTATVKLDDLRREGINEERLEEITLRTNEFDKSLDVQLSGKHKRKSATSERIDTGNTLFGELRKICNTGKDIWYETDAVKYKHYLMYKHKPSKSPKKTAEISGEA